MSETNSVNIIVGVDTHKDVHAAVAINGIGARLGTLTIPVSPQRLRGLETWPRAFGSIHAFGVEGTGLYGAGLSRFLLAKGHTVVEVNRPNRQLRHQNGKSDPLDTQSAARAVLGGSSVTIPNASVPRPLSPNSAAPVRFQPRAGKRTEIASTGEATGRRMLHCIEL